ncbi:RNA-dependent RNA polymerase [Sanxia water strider virus 13]|uniref:RNA-dependent RNA polymerase n=1 Tax=Sanxia water strider virus 13 TaxID=1923397 RepID=UPI00090BA39C|nr:RNA-dependent RNA polymerase [Sanxia water strider virus 13]APG77184.1 RNA-dependent RNA polymerase [Sanxia water strider virus 13]
MPLQSMPSQKVNFGSLSAVAASLRRLAREGRTVGSSQYATFARLAEKLRGLSPRQRRRCLSTASWVAGGLSVSTTDRSKGSSLGHRLAVVKFAIKLWNNIISDVEQFVVDYKRVCNSAAYAAVRGYTSIVAAGKCRDYLHRAFGPCGIIPHKGRRSLFALASTTRCLPPASLTPSRVKIELEALKSRLTSVPPPVSGALLSELVSFSHDLLRDAGPPVQVEVTGNALGPPGKTSLDRAQLYGSYAFKGVIMSKTLLMMSKSAIPPDVPFKEDLEENVQRVSLLAEAGDKVRAITVPSSLAVQLAGRSINRALIRCLRRSDVFGPGFGKRPGTLMSGANLGDKHIVSCDLTAASDYLNQDVAIAVLADYLRSHASGIWYPWASALLGPQRIRSRDDTYTTSRGVLMGTPLAWPILSICHAFACYKALGNTYQFLCRIVGDDGLLICNASQYRAYVSVMNRLGFVINEHKTFQGKQCGILAGRLYVLKTRRAKFQDLNSPTKTMAWRMVDCQAPYVPELLAARGAQRFGRSDAPTAPIRVPGLSQRENKAALRAFKILNPRTFTDAMLRAGRPTPLTTVQRRGLLVLKNAAPSSGARSLWKSSLAKRGHYASLMTSYLRQLMDINLPACSKAPVNGSYLARMSGTVSQLVTARLNLPKDSRMILRPSYVLSRLGKRLDKKMHTPKQSSVLRLLRGLEAEMVPPSHVSVMEKLLRSMVGPDDGARPISGVIGDFSQLGITSPTELYPQFLHWIEEGAP